MKPTYIIALVAFTGAFGSSSAPAWDQDPFAQYIQRSDTITFGAGDAKAVNSATHVIDPWPAYVGNTRILSNGERMSDAVQRYRDVSKLLQAPRPISPGTSDGMTYPGAGAASGAAPASR